MIIQDVAKGENFDGSAETKGAFHFKGDYIFEGGSGDDIIDGGHANNYFTGNGGADVINCNANRDILYYNLVSDSTSTTYDTVNDFNPNADFFNLTFAVSAVDAKVSAGALSTASFDTDLAAAIGASQLGADHAVIFTPNSGTLSGDHFLIIDANGVAGYQASQDLVILLGTPSNLNFTTSNFTT